MRQSRRSISGESDERRVRGTEVDLGSTAWSGGGRVAGGAWWIGVVLRSCRIILPRRNRKIVAADQKNAELTEKLEATNARLRATSETLGQSVGVAQKQIELRTQSIIAQQKVATAKLEEEAAKNSKADWRGLDRCCEREDGCGRREDGRCNDEV